MEKITCAAVHYPEWKMVHLPKNIKGGIVIAWHRHCNCLEVLWDIFEWKVEQTFIEQWFLTNKNRFLDRADAREVAKAANQIIKRVSRAEILYSENLY